MSDSFLRISGLHKRFVGVHALRGAELTVERGELHALVGANGSGKSTLINILSGQIAPDGGTITLAGDRLRLGRSEHALAAGIATVTQETTLVPQLSVAENILLGPRKVRGPLGIDWQATRGRAAEILELLGARFPVDVRIANLRPDQQQLVEIARAISMNARLLLLDEPTSSLTEDEVDALFSLVRSLQERGLTTIFVSHRMSELFAIADRITVLRDGRTVESGPVSSYDPKRIIELMVGHAPEPTVAPARVEPGDRPLLRVDDLSSGHVVGAAFTVAAGECVGLAGLTGAGRTELLDTIFGLRRATHGRIQLDGRELRARRVTDAIARGVAYVPGDRKNLGLILSMTLAENVVMPATSARRRLLVPSRKRERARVSAVVGDFGIRAASPDVPVATLSGGNQQKAVLAKWMHTGPRLLLMDEPTRGVDVAAKAEIHRLLAEARSRGVGILVSSSENEELQLLCDRILVMFRGRIVAELDRAAATDANLAHFAMGAH
ncbi:MAG TPA: sugar ABC transporter ATP-binding protein [Gaiellaceae bacterium]